jgi:hypothetical protein
VFHTSDLELLDHLEIHQWDTGSTEGAREDDEGSRIKIVINNVRSGSTLEAAQ